MSFLVQCHFHVLGLGAWTPWRIDDRQRFDANLWRWQRELDAGRRHLERHMRTVLHAWPHLKTTLPQHLISASRKGFDIIFIFYCGCCAMSYRKMAPIRTSGSLCFSALCMMSDANVGARTEAIIKSAAELAAVSWSVSSNNSHAAGMASTNSSSLKMAAPLISVAIGKWNRLRTWFLMYLKMDEFSARPAAPVLALFLGFGLGMFRSTSSWIILIKMEMVFKRTCEMCFVLFSSNPYRSFLAKLSFRLGDVCDELWSDTFRLRPVRRVPARAVPRIFSSGFVMMPNSSP